ncbi:MAG: hypothetical protein P1P74_09885 [Desulfuromonadales bacterium]|nr:hypothetical protein [Desulfuromonadales bacterium]
MFRIRRIYDDLRPVNQAAFSQLRQILREQFPLLAQRDIDKIPELLHNPRKQGFRSVLYVAEDGRQRVQGFALLSHEANLTFCFLDYIFAAKCTTGGGIGTAYETPLKPDDDNPPYLVFDPLGQPEPLPGSAARPSFGRFWSGATAICARRNILPSSLILSRRGRLLCARHVAAKKQSLKRVPAPPATNGLRWW